MTLDDLAFLYSMMDFVEGGISEENEILRKEWEYQFRRALDDHFPIQDDDGEDEE